jgi:tripartite-type tricarboxylate transporter receptor subunit TctC
VNALNAKLKDALRLPDIVQRCRQEEFEIMASSPEELETLLASEVKKYTSLVKERSLRLD